MLLLSGFALGAMSVMGLVIYRDHGHLRVARAFVAMLFAGACFLIEPQLQGWPALLAQDIYTMVPALFWVLCQIAFSHRPKMLSPVGFIALYTFFAPMLARHFIEQPSPTENLIYWIWPSYCEYVMIALGIWTVMSNWSDDLVESRRQLRGIVLIGVGISVLLVVVPMNTHIVGRWLPHLSVNVIALLCAYFLLHTEKKGFFYELETPDMPPVQEEHHQQPSELQQEANRLDTLMQTGFYRTEHLTLKELADKLALPEYKTRNLINQTLGYRNFNDYINQLRIQEAAQTLLQNPDTPVLNISLDVGYRTLSSFNRAFKDIMTMSPSEYRQKSLTDPE